jgi:hypothetical protein
MNAGLAAANITHDIVSGKRAANTDFRNKWCAKFNKWGKRYEADIWNVTTKK